MQISVALRRNTLCVFMLDDNLVKVDVGPLPWNHSQADLGSAPNVPWQEYTRNLFKRHLVETRDEGLCMRTDPVVQAVDSALIR